MNIGNFGGALASQAAWNAKRSIREGSRSGEESNNRDADGKPRHACRSGQIIKPQEGLIYSGENASNAFPGTPTLRGYPELMKTMPSTTTGPGPSIEPPCASTPFTAFSSCIVL